MRAKTREELFEGACQAAVLGGVFASATIGIMDDQRELVRVVAVKGRLIASALYWETDQRSNTRLVLFHSLDHGDHFASPLPIVADSEHRLVNVNPVQFLSFFSTRIPWLTSGTPVTFAPTTR